MTSKMKTMGLKAMAIAFILVLAIGLITIIGTIEKRSMEKALLVGTESYTELKAGNVVEVEGATTDFLASNIKDVEVAFNYGIKGDNSNKVTSSASLSDGGVLIGGYFYNEADVNGDGKIDLEGDTYQDGFIIKYDEDGSVVFAKAITGKNDIQILDVIETQTGFVAVGFTRAMSIAVNGKDTGLSANGTKEGLILSFKSDGSYSSGAILSGNGQEEFVTVTELSNGYIVAGGNYSSSSLKSNSTSLNVTDVTKESGIVVCYDKNLNAQYGREFVADGNAAEVTGVAKDDASTGFAVALNTYGDCYVASAGNTGLSWDSSIQYGVLIGYDESGKVIYANYMEASIIRLTDIVSLPGRGYILTGAHYDAVYSLNTSYNEKNVLSSVTSYSGMVLLLDENLGVVSAQTLVGSSSNYPNMITSADYSVENGESYIYVGGYSCNDFYVDANKSDKISASAWEVGFVIKYEMNGTNINYADWNRQFTGSTLYSTKEVRTVSVLNDGSIVAGGWYNSETLDVDQTSSDDKNLENSGYQAGFQDGFITVYGSNSKYQEFEINKVNEYGDPIEGVKFTITNTDTKESNTFSTDENGYILTELEYGEYIVKESETVYGYKLDENEYKIKVDANGITFVD